MAVKLLRMDVKINPKYRALVPQLRGEEYEALERDIIANGGAFSPIDINKENEILDGHSRFEICTKHALYFDTRVVDLPSELDEEIYVIKSNLIRRQLTDFEKVELAKPLEERIAEKARLNQSIGGKIGADSTNLGVSSNEEKPTPINTSAMVAKEIGVSKSTYERAKKVRDEGTEEEKKKARSKKYAVNSAYRDVVKRIKVEELVEKGVPPLPDGKYDVILADPPWEYDLQLRGEPGLHYATMKQEEIKALNIPTDNNCILFLWATNPKLENALEVLRAWGFEYKTNMVWVKDIWGNGFYFRGQHELLLVGVKGDFSPPPEHIRRSSVLHAPRGKHSEKPEKVYEIIEAMYPWHTYLELFARNEREGWKAWGLEVNG